MRMVVKQIQRELADMLTRDPVMKHAILPKAAPGSWWSPSPGSSSALTGWWARSWRWAGPARQCASNAMGASRKLQGEIDRVLKKVQEGVDVFDNIWNKARTHAPPSFLSPTLTLDSHDFA
mgnify:CR=1 FL=1